MNNKKSPSILIVGGTGTQGGNVARELLQFGHLVRVLTRNPNSLAAKQIEQLGAEIVQGDLGDPDSLIPVMKDVEAIFSAQYSDPKDPSVEPRNTKNMVESALNAGVQQIIHTSVVGTNIFPRWNKSQILSQMWENKYQAEEYIRQGGFSNWTILHPSFFMENFTEPLSTYMAPELKFGKLFGVLNPETPIKLNCGQDTALFARIGFENPEKFHKKDINIAADELSMREIAAILSKTVYKTVIYEKVNAVDGIRRGLFQGTVESHQWMNDVPGWGFDLKETSSYGLPLKSFKKWIEENRNQIAI
ncbi:NmrA/HSCARG family protein [Rhabdobacter roseus]|uniref:Uncharacterized protein YbjT (DUF2867 family) n=1 Tax=Rhabdobacter roseus TaxID=1655419 RepID=A0A840U3F5_9BACT|nr:NmrA/HSCARG family protein [Rhabdobacter roseus]MBB5286858.1 uncharacterized protein YbjT (DUF2867 family) [Rhabdobacter roseus]